MSSKNKKLLKKVAKNQQIIKQTSPINPKTIKIILEKNSIIPCFKCLPSNLPKNIAKEFRKYYKIFSWKEYFNNMGLKNDIS